jgi:hypothetical protein
LLGKQVRPERARRRCVHDRRVIKIGIRIVRLSHITITDLRSVAELERYVALAELEDALRTTGSAAVVRLKPTGERSDRPRLRGLQRTPSCTGGCAYRGGSRSLPVATPGNRVDGFQAVADLAAADG